jgi:S1-C subfamily serine protease/enterochelin esterase-like enzyme
MELLLKVTDMSRRLRAPRPATRVAFLVGLCGLAAASLRAQPRGADVDALEEKAMKTAVQRVAPAVVQIETTGGTDLIPTGPQGEMIRKGVGPTTGLVVSTDGFIISSAFNFADKPAQIFVTIPGRKDRFVAKIVATDHTRMLTLLKVEATGLPVPVAAPKQEFRVGQWSVALGRTWTKTLDVPPSFSIGILSALDRIWGKAVQTDAKVSPVNYGGPLVDIHGRVIGVLVPASPRADNETAGVEWYDSGIGFAIPLADINAVLPKMKQGHDLRAGLLGVLMQGQDMYGPQAVIGTVFPASAAARAGIKPGDAIVEIDGRRVANQAQLKHVLGNKYEGDVVSVKVKRGDKELSFANLRLGGLQAAVADAFLGVLPLRDDPELGMQIRYVYPKSPADKAGLKAGERIASVTAGTGMMAMTRQFSGRDELMQLLAQVPAGTEVKLGIHRTDGKSDTVTLRLDLVPEAVPATLPEPASLKKALAPRKQAMQPGPGMKPKPQEAKKPAANKPPTGFLERSNATRDHEYWMYVPDDYDPNISYALVVWLHPPRKGLDRKAFDKVIQEFVDKWADLCQDKHIILLGPKAENETGWLLTEGDFIQESIRDVMSQYTIDKQRVVAHGMGQGGQMAFYLGFHARDLVRGVATSGSVLATQLQENSPAQRLSFFIVAGGKDPLAKSIADTKNKLVDKKFPVVYHEVPDRGHEYLGDEGGPMLEELVRWIDSLDRL